MPPSLGLVGPTPVDGRSGDGALWWSEKRRQSSIGRVWGRLAWFLAGVGVAAAAAARLFRRRPPDAFSQPESPEPLAPPKPLAPPEPAPPEPPVPEPEQPPAATVDDEEEADARAGDLRRRIEESRLLLDERDEFEGAETPVDEADPEARRRDVHDRARQMVERMRGDEPQA
jgi:hypothetical protein